MTQPESLLRPVSIPEREPPQSNRESWLKGLNKAIFVLLACFVILLPHSIKGARYAWMMAFVVWLVTLAVGRKRMFNQPLALPMLAFIALSGLSTAMSYDPYLSWGHMKLICAVALIGTLFAQSLNRLSQVRTLVILLLLSATAAAGFTAWQYTYGIGVRVKSIDPQTMLYRAGIRPNDVITKVDGAPIDVPTQLIDKVQQATPGVLLHIEFLRGVPTRRHATLVSAGVSPHSEIGAKSISLVRAKPVRAQGTLGHYNIFAEVLMLIGCLAWALLLSAQSQKPLIRMVYGVIFLVLTVTIFATQTRAAIAGLVAGCAIAMFLLAKRRTFVWTVAILLVLVVSGTVWIQHARGLSWIDTSDPGTQYRLLMWQDGFRLALHHPAVGVGMESIQDHWQEWNIRAYALYHVYYNFHSDIVQIAAERGLLTLAAWLWFVVAYLIYLVRLVAKSRQQSHFATGILAGILGGFVAFLITSFVISALNDDSLVMLLFSCFGIAVAIDRMLSQPTALDVP